MRAFFARGLRLVIQRRLPGSNLRAQLQQVPRPPLSSFTPSLSTGDSEAASRRKMAEGCRT